ncbi:hypothetical protein [Desulfurobacterium atlanticum]|uniref:Uncharacterized protein n=1 Tax=Desulfurobacterium atlanticum TaxID=240169 RepID=A0A238Y7Q1_9BACT|nr:hypothetical protein [Desulfurobacterium atlanticum]SNR66858.1 hypothetical protein SAMN06265340_102170 [Desulfurobacterium atlanticum]
MKLKIDGKEQVINIDTKKYKKLKEVLRLVEFHYLFPSRVIRTVEVKGKPVPPDMLDFIENVSEINIITDSTANFIKKHIELSVIALDSMENAVEAVIESFDTSSDLARLHLNYITDSILKTVEIVEKGSNFLPLLEDSEEAVVNIEEKILKLNELEDKEEIIKFLKEELLEGVEKWKEFLLRLLMTMENSSRETH